ncbi:hypothetical protein ADICYQ_1926 [Cyclobacterium qasimii M12-11B]|uniref:Uncharacterized protein n=1 Tax=Cyclobacterium qasimii M12-11B TaxID=641524 RepID=S7VGA1_9BACT|nr:hypothetical protein ADICYQ_1926 [Cyclobacterium qasimii M12-11B]
MMNADMAEMHLVFRFGITILPFGLELKPYVFSLYWPKK